MQEHLSILLCGPTGVGKSYMACAFGQSACRRGHRVLYRRVSRLLDELALARAEGTCARLLAPLAKIEGFDSGSGDEDAVLRADESVTALGESNGTAG